MERDLPARLLAGDDEASVAAPTALCSGASYVVWNGTASAQSLTRFKEFDRGCLTEHLTGQALAVLDVLLTRCSAAPEARGIPSHLPLVRTMIRTMIRTKRP
ncbi:hypothetical protein J7E87_15355 [Streptomyces sp. ISL-1]|uniref:hypothetical protein n=1 Tax=Streptomyces sp. ISL-1 TaxID=2817657 RepID=UPI001BE8C833|nr:hypothetical protein [Streptomyces sp. ISL-1]MBT2390761.1 hypothetical protein [Streptomyces sp. ISL-1]